ncbi:trichohyalin-like [Haliotis rufescens]|uniref:trichohyalin-like n=1 Tax=Haliotis rufescens TaxID=6454 RepID=UPI001EAFEE43|nr:trichohyalin-like [Haliotis rufescens]
MGLFSIKSKKQYVKKGGRRKKGYVPRNRTEKKKQKRNTSNKVLVEDEELMSREQLQKKLKNRNCSITVSGKRRSKMLKRLRHTVKNDSKFVQDEVEMEEEPQQKKKTKKSKKSKEVDMEEDL